MSREQPQPEWWDWITPEIVVNAIHLVAEQGSQARMVVSPPLPKEPFSSPPPNISQATFTYYEVMAVDIIAAGLKQLKLTLLPVDAMVRVTELAECAYRIGVGLANPMGDGFNAINGAVGRIHNAAVDEMRASKTGRDTFLELLLSRWRKKKEGT